MRAVIGLGSNLGDRLAALRAAVEEIRGLGRIEAISRVYETEPVGGPPQPDHLNAAILLDYEGEPLALLDALQVIEAKLGRVRTERWGARTIDLDVLWIDGQAVDDPRLTVPHPRLTERAFALVPLLEVAPGAVDPRTGAGFVEVRGQRIVATDATLSLPR